MLSFTYFRDRLGPNNGSHDNDYAHLGLFVCVQNLMTIQLQQLQDVKEDPKCRKWVAGVIGAI